MYLFFTIFHGIQRILIFQDPKNYKISTNFGDLINKQFFDIVDFRSINEESPKFKSIKCGIQFFQPFNNNNHIRKHHLNMYT